VDLADILQYECTGFEVFGCEESALSVCGVGGGGYGCYFDEGAGSFRVVWWEVFGFLGAGAEDCEV